MWTGLRRMLRRYLGRAAANARYNRLLPLNKHLVPVELLEERRMLATFADAAPALNLGLLANDQVSILSTGSSYTLTLGSSHTWTGTNDANVSGNGTSTLTVTAAGITAFTSAINISDSSSGGGDSVAFSNSLSSGYANNFVITLTQLLSGVTFSGASSFTTSSTLTATANGAILINTGASITSAGGAISLASTGSNVSLTADGNVISNGGSITLQATGAVTVGTSTVVNSAAGTLTLAADVTASGSGDDGVGTLSINAGATVVSSNTSANAITLRGANIHIDTSSNPAVVGASRQFRTTPGFSDPDALVFDSSGNLYVANYLGNTVSEFSPGSATAIATYSAGLSGPHALAFDSSGNLYVANSGNNTVSEFAPGSTTVSATYSAGLSAPQALAFDSSGNLYVANEGSGTVSKFAPGATMASASYSADLSNPYALGFDSSGNLYVININGDTVVEFASKTTTATAIYSGLSTPEALAFDSSGSMYVANEGNNTVEKFAPGSTTVSATYSTGLSQPVALAFDSSGNLYVANSGTNTLDEFPPGGSIPTAGGVVIQSSVESRPMLIGGTNTVQGINLTTAELAQIQTLSTGTITIGDPAQTGNITFDTATPATTTGAGLNVIQSTSGAGQIILNDGPGTATALNGNGGSIFLTAGTGGISALAASNSTAEIATTGASVTLLTSGPIGTSTNRLQFSDDANTAQQIVSIGSTSIQPSSAYLDGLGNLTLGNVLGGASNSTIDVTARTNLVVAPGATINSGTSTLSLGADLTAAKTGDNGVGTLSIDAGATVVSSNSSANAITLRGADISVDTSSNPAVVGAPRPAGTTPTAGGVVIQSSVGARPMLIGGTDSNPVAGINLTSVELAQISTTAAGTIMIGDPTQTGNITFTTATPATTAGAALNVFTGGAGQIILDDGSGTATALNGNGGSIFLTAGTGGISALAASNSTAEIATTGASVTLLTSGPIGTSTNRIQFSDDANTAQQIVSIGSTTIQPSSAYLDGLGNLTLGNILGGSTNATIDVTARTNLVVAAGATINSGTSTLSLGADLTAAKAGDDGVGTLSIDAGATVVSSNSSANAITLRGANINIDTSSNPAVVGAKRQLATTPIDTYSSGVSDPQAVAVDSSRNVYVANTFLPGGEPGTTVSEFASGGTTPTANITGLSDPDVLAFDSSGNVYVATFEGVDEFAPGSTTPSATYSRDINDPDALAFDSDGNLYVANYESSLVSEFAPGSTTPSATYSTPGQPNALAFDSSGNLYVATSDGVNEFAAGSTTVSALYSTGSNNDAALVFDSSGNLYVADRANNTVSKFAPGSTTASATYHITGALAIDSSGDLYVASGNKVSEFAPGSTGVIATFTSGISSPSDLTFDFSGDLYVANSGNNTVNEFAPSSSTTPTAGGVVIQSSVESRPMLIGGTNSDPVQGINLTTAELAQIQTTSTGTVTIGDSAQTGNITFSTAKPASTPGAALNVIQSTAGPGQIILDDGAGSGTALNGNNGTVTLTPGTGDIQTTLFATGTPLATKGFSVGGTTFNLVLGFAPTPGTQLTIVNDTATPAASNLISGTFLNLAQGSTVSLNYQGTAYTFHANYQAGDGNDLVLTSPATPNLSVTDNGGTYSGSAFPATTASLEGVTPSLIYYSGTIATGTALGGVPTTAGIYTVLASFAGSTDYTSGTASTTFTISQSAPALSVTDHGGTYTGAAFTATDAVAGVGSQSMQASSLEGVTPSLAYYSGTSTSGTSLSGAPTTVGTYTVLASFAGSTDYTSATASTSFEIATPPTSLVSALPLRTSQTSFTLNWSGTAGSGGPIAGYYVSVSVDHDAFQAVPGSPFPATTTSTTFTEPLDLGHTYGFISQAYDLNGDIEPAHAEADTTITTSATPWQNPNNSLDVLGMGEIVPGDALAVINYLNNNPLTATLPSVFSGGSNYLDVLGKGFVDPSDALAIINFLNTVPMTQTMTSLTSSSSSGPSGQPVTFTATVAANFPSTAIPTGMVTFYDGATVLGTGTMNNSGVATLTTSALALGAHSIQAVYDSGATAQANFAGSTSSVLTQTVNVIPAMVAQPLTRGADSPTPNVESDADALVVAQVAVQPSSDDAPGVSPAVMAVSLASGAMNTATAPPLPAPDGTSPTSASETVAAIERAATPVTRSGSSIKSSISWTQALDSLLADPSGDWWSD